MPAAPPASDPPPPAADRSLARRLLAWEERGHLSPSLLLGDAAIAAWLVFALFSFTDRPWPAAGPLVAGAAATALLAHLVRWHRRSLWPAAVFAPLLGAGMFVLRARGWLVVTTAEILWLTAVGTLALGALRVAFRAARARHPDQPLEVMRWVAVGAGATALFLPFYHAGTLGTGDAQWYVVMFSDFITQCRAGVFPVWAGQSIYAFNGAISPLRFAPWYQYAGGLLDLLTGRSLGFGALSNAVLAVNGLVSGLAAYHCLRDILPRRPGLACLLALLFLGSPGILAPLFVGNQYMTFMATPFIALVLNGMFRLWTRDDLSGPLRLAVGLAGAWVSHAPIALWCTLLAVVVGALVVGRRRQWSADRRRLVSAGIVFGLLGSLPFLSTLAIDNLNTSPANPAVAVDTVRTQFPANFAPIKVDGDLLSTYQVGYGALAALALAVFFWPRRPPRGTWLFVGATLAVAPIVLPVPWLNQAFWTHVPSWFLTINNVWPMQRLFGIWAALMVFTAAVVISDHRLSGSGTVGGVCFIVLAAVGLWTWQEGRKLAGIALTSYRPAATAATWLGPQNVVLSRYAYSTFAFVPGYVSHGYMAPLLENRILAHDTLALMTANADRAALPVRPDAGSEHIPRLVASGLLTAQQDPGGKFYLLTPPLPLRAGEHEAVRLQVLEATESGLLQFSGPDLYREYLLPDSGLGLDHHGPPLAFGALPTSSKVIPLEAARTGQELTARYFPDGYSMRKRYAFARYWLFRYAPADLPVVVRSWIPYRAETEVAVPAWLETPRIWLKGYRAQVNGRPAAVRRSPENLVMVELPPGRSDVTLTYQAPWWLRLSFWSCAGAWLVVIAASFRRTVAASQRPSAPA